MTHTTAKQSGVCETPLHCERVRAPRCTCGSVDDRAARTCASLQSEGVGIDRRVVSIVRFALAGTVAGAAWRGAAWLYRYQEGVVIKWVDRTGHQFQPPSHSTQQPWWASPATVLLLLLGTTLVLWLIPDGRRLLKRYAEHFGLPNGPKAARRRQVAARRRAFEPAVPRSSP
jgi:hypothetical protein